MSEVTSTKPEYIYGVVSMLDRIVGRFLNSDGVVFKDDPENPGSKRAVVHVFAMTKEEALALPRDVAELAYTLKALAADLRHFIGNHEFPNDPKEEESSSPQTT